MGVHDGREGGRNPNFTSCSNWVLRNPEGRWHLRGFGEESGKCPTTSTWGHQTPVILCETSRKYPTKQETRPKDDASHICWALTCKNTWCWWSSLCRPHMSQLKCRTKIAVGFKCLHSEARVGNYKANMGMPSFWKTPPKLHDRRIWQFSSEVVSWNCQISQILLQTREKSEAWEKQKYPWLDLPVKPCEKLCTWTCELFSVKCHTSHDQDTCCLQGGKDAMSADRHFYISNPHN